ncbi:CrcB protein [Pseudonocardia sp. Ae168_Ps1]|uniref:fluoride efflux transporter CrcB n=1 Tax=unclassified Pseudonocardia TaxID=2619320 RepID=UPI00094B5684|nr:MULTISPECIES: fluoride efflux transporter CrcB [unclassified Pseudonocardia]OLL73423.1 CrcB protein [Pseudonocardia sp. Ae150A_Ps1]OLL79399.1 CrcB protein [Pseudonocardia sp. Ae168_Ps1]OLL86466.1 CrcB protein [Pseudonocardia sp. Ae263_Ps1]OLL93485.1 hypothetical protein Ae356Ps1_3382c [Pseudonocardia sp. Ae356_Ps1]OLL93493.1 CrcB protein [Pseudonocardia sp. Ae356_Ps1]
MTASSALLVALGAAVGAPLRYMLDRLGRRVVRTAFPWGTFAANVIGSFVLGGLAGASAALPPWAQLLAATGFCGALTTYSTFSYEVVALLDVRERLTATAYLLVSMIVGVGSAAAGWALAGLAV